MTPERIGSYRVLGVLGEGMSGIVYRAIDDNLGREVAIKALREELTYDEIQIERFRNDARIMANLKHPNIVQVYALFPEGRRLFIVMELLPDNLEAFIKRSQRLDLPTTLRIAQQAVSALAAVHAQGVTHRDIKPANLMLTETGELRVGDFSIARIEGAKRATSTGTAIGTAEYMAPEQIRGKAGDGRTDIYALACVVTEMLVGRPPFQGETATDICHSHLHTQPQSLADRLPGLPRHVSEAVRKALSKDPADRFADIELFGQALAGVTPHSAPVTARPRMSNGAIAVIAASVLLLSVGSFVGYRLIAGMPAAREAAISQPVPASVAVKTAPEPVSVPKEYPPVTPAMASVPTPQQVRQTPPTPSLPPLPSATPGAGPPPITRDATNAPSAQPAAAQPPQAQPPQAQVASTQSSGGNTGDSANSLPLGPTTASVGSGDLPPSNTTSGGWPSNLTKGEAEPSPPAPVTAARTAAPYKPRPVVPMTSGSVNGGRRSAIDLPSLR